MADGAGRIVGRGVADRLGSLDRARHLGTRPGYTFRSVEGAVVAGTPAFRVLSVHDTPPASFYADQHLHVGLNDLTMRDGITLAATRSRPSSRRPGTQRSMKDITLLRKYSSRLSQMAKIQIGGDGRPGQQLTLLNLESIEFTTHPVVLEDFSKSKYLEKILAKVADEKPESYEKLLATEGWRKDRRALALVGEIIYGASLSYEDPARYSFAHGGKDATPYPVDRKTYDETIMMSGRAVRKTRLPLCGQKESARPAEWHQRNAAPICYNSIYGHIDPRGHFLFCGRRL